MSGKSVYNLLQDNVSKPRFCKSLSTGETWSSKSMVALFSIERIIPEDVRWGNSWQLWLQRDKNGLFMEEEDWDEFVSDNFLGPNDVLLFIHVDTMFIEVQIYKQDSYHLKEITSAPLQTDPKLKWLPRCPRLLHQKPLPLPLHLADALVNNPEQYLSNPSNPFYVKKLGKKIDVLYVSHLVTERYGLQFGPHNSPMFYILPNEKIEANTKIYGGCACFNGWAAICRKYKLKQGDAVVCELERSGGVVTAVRLHFPNE
ncbi:hypothetical protein HID58_094936 [Brassica napus]|uniref:TF-B3 domain-containing protein n=1 Tax=Brassica napus TaxID=3708 RepID=A0ABQ7X5G3_BRANA|nr:hypothetical protein HID58_094936 [Brassica napus]